MTWRQFPASMRFLSPLLIVTLLLGAAARAQTPAQLDDWQYWRDAFLNQQKSHLLQSCNKGRQKNALGQPYWEGQQTLRDQMLRGGMAASQFEALVAGLSAAMTQACPEVRQR